jgi:hypothetical protein
MSGAPGGDAPLFSCNREEGDSLAFGTKPGGGSPLGTWQRTLASKVPLRASNCGFQNNQDRSYSGTVAAPSPHHAPEASLIVRRATEIVAISAINLGARLDEFPEIATLTTRASGPMHAIRNHPSRSSWISLASAAAVATWWWNP